MQAGAQQELPSCFGETPTIVGTPGNDHIRGTPGPDVIQALGGNDVVHALGGDDTICGDTGHDKLFGGKGNDTLHKESGGGLFLGGPGDDRLFGGLGDDRMYGGPGSDFMIGGTGDEEDFHPGRDRMYGGPGNDSLDGGQGADRVFGGPGNDTVSGGVGSDWSDYVSGGPGDDEVNGSFGGDRLYGGAGDDSFFPAEGHDKVSGGPGNDKVQDAQGDDLIRGGPGNDELVGAEDNDTIYGGPGDDRIDGGVGDDTLYGNVGNDRIFGGPGDDHLFGGLGDDFLEGGPGLDELNGGPGQNTLVDEPPPPPKATLTELIDLNSRTGIRDWAASRTIATMDSEVAALDHAHRDKLPEVVLDTNATGEARDKMLRVMHRALAIPELGFYTEIWSYTYVEIVPPGFFGTCNHIMLDPSAWGGLSDQDAYNVFLHENFHSFNCVNGGPNGALNEGSAIWITLAPYDQSLTPGESFAETTYGTALYYRDIAHVPNYPLEAAANPTQKLIDVYTYMSAHDPAQLPWNSNDRLVNCFNLYFVDLNRDVDFNTVWLPEVKQRTDQMLADPNCKPL